MNNNNNDWFDDSINPRKNMSKDLKKSIINEIKKNCSLSKGEDFFKLIKSKVDNGCYVYDFPENYLKVKQTISKTIYCLMHKNNHYKIFDDFKTAIDCLWYEKNRSKMYNAFNKTISNEDERYLYLLTTDLSDFIINENMYNEKIDNNSFYKYVIVFISELNKLIIEEQKDIKSICNKIKPILDLYKKDRKKEYFLEHFNSLDCYISSTIRISRELLRYYKVNAQYQLPNKEDIIDEINALDIAVMKDEMLTALISRVRELYLNKTEHEDSVAFTYLIKITNTIDESFKRKNFNKRLTDITNKYNKQLKVFGIKRNKKNSHITTYKDSIVKKEKIIQKVDLDSETHEPNLIGKSIKIKKETTITIPEVYEILDAFVDVYLDYRNTIIDALDLPNDDLPKRAVIEPVNIRKLYFDYSLK